VAGRTLSTESSLTETPAGLLSSLTENVYSPAGRRERGSARIGRFAFQCSHPSRSPAGHLRPHVCAGDAASALRDLPSTLAPNGLEPAAS